MSIQYTINAYFVTTTLTNDGESSSLMAEVLKLLIKEGQVPKENVRQITASEGFPLIASGNLTKKDVFIFDKFEGDFFTQLQQTKSLIIGPRCLCSCLMKSLPIPLGTSPVYTTAMRDINISATGITPKEKEQLRTLIQWMGGYYFQNFGRSITHLISNTIKSTKYEHATLNGIPVMHVDWVQRVWDRSCVTYVVATDDEFDKYHLPIFFGTNITCTGLETDKKNEVSLYFVLASTVCIPMPLKERTWVLILFIEALLKTPNFFPIQIPVVIPMSVPISPSQFPSLFPSQCPFLSLLPSQLSSLSLFLFSSLCPLFPSVAHSCSHYHARPNSHTYTRCYPHPFLHAYAQGTDHFFSFKEVFHLPGSPYERSRLTIL